MLRTAILGKRLVASVAVAVCAAAGPAPDTRSPSQSPVLEMGVRTEREFGGGDSHDYQFRLREGEYAKIVLFQRSINVAVECIGPDGRQRFEADSQRIDDSEIAELIGDTSGTYQLRVTAPDRQAPWGRYNITLLEVEVANERHRSRIAASRVYSQAWKNRKEASREALFKSIGNLEVAAGYWHGAGDLFEEARTLMITGVFYAHYGDRKKALDLTRRAITVAQESHDRRIEAWAYVDHSLVLTFFEDKLRAIEYSDRALPMMRAVGDRAGEAGALTNLGRAYAQTGQGRKGIMYLEDALRIYREVQDRESIATVTTNLGITYDNLGEYKRGLDIHQQILTLHREVGHPSGEAAALNNIGTSYCGLGEYQKALDVYRAALEVNRKFDNRRGIAVNLHNIATVYRDLGDWRRALKFYEEALGILRSSGDQWGLGQTLNNMGTTYAELEDYTSALRFHNEALTFRRAVSDVVGEASTLNNLGRTYLDLGVQGKALDHFERSLTILRKSGELLTLAGTLRSFGRLFSDGGEPARALPYLEEALQISCAIRDRRGEATALALVARVEHERGNFELARLKAGEAVAAFESLRLGIASPALRASFFASAREAQEVEIDSLMRLHAESPGKGFDAMALLSSEKGRARSLLETLGEVGLEIRRGVDAGLLARERELQQLISAKADMQVRLLSRDHSAAQAHAAAQELEALTAELEQVESRIRATSPQFAALTRPAARDLAAIQTNVLDNDTILLEYSLGRDRSYLFVVARDKMNAFELPSRAEIESVAKHFYDLLTARNQKPANETAARRAGRLRQADADLSAVASAASRMLLAPAAALLQNKTLLIVADGPLQYVPFAALPSPAATDGPVPLAVNHEVVSAPSASVIAVLREETAARRPAEKSLAILADPVFSADDPRILRNGRTAPAAGEGVRSAADARTADFTRLRFSRTEADQIARFSPPASTLKAFDLDANRDLALQSDLGQYRILHFATHSLIDNVHPELSAVVLSLVDRSGQPQNGFLRLYDVYNLRLRSDLVVLSACRTALGQDIKGEGLVGLTRGFLYAGARRVVATLWEIDDRTTSEVMKLFYEAMQVRGERPAAALRTAQVAIWKSKGWEAPYYWGAFTLQGEWR